MKCHHEWESCESFEECDWCGAGSYILAEYNYNIYEILRGFLYRLEQNKQINKRSGQ
jgi:hypothetical protein